jgi:hypothetical protein
MRLRRVEHAHRLREKIILAMIRLTTGFRAPDIVRTLFYRPEFFGRAMSAWTHAVMRGPSAWTVGEREIFAAVTSRLNHCPF